jgi:hypothetical protein
MSVDEQQQDINNDDHILQSVRQALDESVESLDGATLSALNQVRHGALVAPVKSWWQVNKLPLSAAVSAMLMLAVWIGQPQSSDDTVPVLAEAKLELLQVDLEMLEDLEMLFWLAEMQADDELA